MINMC